MDETQEKFLALLKQQESALEDLHNLLTKEMHALKARDTDLLYELIKSKNELLNKVGMLDKQRQLYLEGEEKSLINDSFYINQINNLGEEIKIKLDKCKHQNKINGGIIEMSQLFNEKILNIMQGKTNTEITYSAEGKNKPGNTQHSLARV